MGEVKREHRDDQHEQYLCQRCNKPTKLLTVLPKTTLNPTFWIYGCGSCGFIEWIEDKSDR